MRRLLAATVAAVSAAGALAGCGSTHHPAVQTVKLPAQATSLAKAPVVPAQVISRHVCDPRDYVTGCALPAQTLPDIVRAPNVATAPTLQGVDFGWSCPVSSARNFGASYLSTDSSKNWGRSCVDLFHSQHKGTVAVWETSATRALDGYSAGQADARSANAQIRALGAPANAHIDYAVDFDETTGQAPAVASYFRGVDSVNGTSRTGAYGGYYTVTRLCAAHLTTASWATYAWSGGQWPSAACAPLEQYLNSSSVDYDRAIASFYGQWPYSPPKPPPSAPRCFGKGWQHGQHCNQVRAQALHLGYHVKQENGYIVVSRRNLTVIEARLAVELKHLAGYRAQLCKLLAGSPLACR